MTNFAVGMASFSDKEGGICDKTSMVAFLMYINVERCWWWYILCKFL